MINFDQFKESHEELFEFAQNINNFDDEELLDIFKRYEIDQNKIKFINIIQMISHFVRYRSRSFETISKFLLNITDILKSTFSEDQIIDAFKASPQSLLDFLFEQKIISKYINESNSTEGCIYTSFYLQNLEEKIGDDDNFENNVQKIESNKKDWSFSIREIIQKDDIDSFQSFISQTNENINSNLIKKPNQNNSSFINSYEKQCQNYIEYAALYGSIQIFKYLWMNNACVSNNLFPVSIYGGNFEIIHLVESKINNDTNFSQNIDQIRNKAATAAVSCFRHELLSYLCDNYSISFEYSALYQSLISFNLPDLLFMIENDFSILNSYSEDLNETIFHNPNHFTQYEIIKYILSNYLELKKLNSIDFNDENEIQMGLKDKIGVLYLFVLLYSTS